MLRPKTAFGRIVGSVLLAAAVVALANLSNPSVVAQTYQNCPGASNPCETCPTTGNTYQCIPPTSYNWGTCSGSSNTLCYQSPAHCWNFELYNCNTPPGQANMPCMKITPQFQVCHK